MFFPGLSWDRLILADPAPCKLGGKRRRRARIVIEPDDSLAKGSRRASHRRARRFAFVADRRTSRWTRSFSERFGIFINGPRELGSLRHPSEAAEAGLVAGTDSSSRKRLLSLRTMNSSLTQDAVGRIWSALSRGPRTLDAIADSTGLSAAQSLAALLRLEWTGAVVALPGQRWARRARGPS